MTNPNGSSSVAGDTRDARRIREAIFPEQLVLAVDHVDGCAIVSARGEIDVTTAPQLADALAEAMDGDGARDVAVDLADVSFLDSKAISVFAKASDSVRARGGRFTLRSPSAAARRVLDLVDLADLMPIDA
jgi:anti-sigma B factor antagonist